MKKNQATPLTRATLTWPGITEKGFIRLFSFNLEFICTLCFFKKLKMHSPVWYLLKNTLMQINPKSNEKGPMITYSSYNHLNHMINRHSSFHGETDPFQHKFSRISFSTYFVAFFFLLFWLKLWNSCRSKCYFLLTNTGALKRLTLSLIRWLVGSLIYSVIIRYHG